MLMKAGKPGYVNEAFVGFDHASSLYWRSWRPIRWRMEQAMCEFEESIERLVLSLKQPVSTALS